MDFRAVILVYCVALPVGLAGVLRASADPAPEAESPTARASEAVRQVTGAAGNLSPGARVGVVNSLGSNLAVADTRELIRFLAAPIAAGEDAGGNHWVKNDVMGRLREQNPPVAELPEALAALYGDASQDPVIRDYALQHLAECRWDQSALKQARLTLEKAVTETNGTLAGTALLGLVRIQKAEGGTLAPLGQTALALARNSKASEISRLTALSVCGQLGEAKALPVALAAANEGQSMMLRIAAVGVLGKLGGQGELAVLARLESAGEARLLPAVRRARKEIEARLGKQNGHGN